MMTAVREEPTSVQSQASATEDAANRKPRLVYLSSIAAPHQVKLCYALQPYFDAEFWFYEQLSTERAAFWKVDLGDRCRILSPVFLRQAGRLSARYVAPFLNRELSRFSPDIVVIGGFSIPSNYAAYRWAKARGKKVVVFTERSRTPPGTLRTWGPIWRGLRFLYRDVDLVMTATDDSVAQFRDEFRFGDRVVAGRYAADLEPYFSHPVRTGKAPYTYLFANRMTEIYNPIGAIDIFAELHRRSPDARLLMNAAGELGPDCRRRIHELELDDSVEFLTDIPSWDRLHEVYARSDILLFPAQFSNGNFTILEAMASGMGIVISDRVLSVGKLVVDGQNGFRCAPTTEAFVERAERYVANPSLFAEHAARNRGIAAPWSTPRTAAFFADVLRERLGV